jgi:uncharacterized HAD superfamily protein
MRIGIDIDDTLNDVKEKLENAGFNYAKSLGKNIVLSDDKCRKDNKGSHISDKFNFTYEELKHFLGPIQDEIINNANPKNNASNILKKLKELGHEIYIITARDSEFHEDPYKQSKEWLDSNNIVFDKLIVNAIEKDIICKEENIDLFIDDSLYNCISVSNLGIKTILFSNNESNYSNIISISNWNDIYKYIESIK